MQSAFNRRLDALLDENAGASKEKMFHLEVQILPGIAAYETLQTIMPKEEAVQIIHDIIEQHSREIRKTLDKLMLIPGLYRCFCDSDDVSYDNLHPKLLWHRTKTLGRGNDCCNFCLKIR